MVVGFKPQGNRKGLVANTNNTPQDPPPPPKPIVVVTPPVVTPPKVVTPEKKSLIQKITSFLKKLVSRK